MKKEIMAIRDRADNMNDGLNAINDVAELLKLIDDKFADIEKCVIRVKNNEPCSEGLLVNELINDIIPMTILNQECRIKLKRAYKDLTAKQGLMITDLFKIISKEE